MSTTGQPPAGGRTAHYGILLLIGLWLVWGTSWPAMRMVFTEVPVWQFRAVTCAISGIALLAIALATGERWRVPWRHWGVLIAAAIFNMVIWQICVGYGLSMLGAGHGAIITYTLPIWTAAISVLVLKERLTWRKALAVALGAAGVLVLLSSDFAAIGTSPLGAAYLLAAAIGWAIGTIIVKRVAWTVGMYTLAGWQLLISCVPMTAIALAAEPFMLHQIRGDTLWAALYVTFIALIAGYALWFKIVEHFPAIIASLGSLMVPVLGVASGALILGEPLGWIEGAALALVLTAISLVLFGGAKAKRALDDPAE
ncbi:MAG TPA: DMT family transporter [Alphaproteobacteria bacterium]|nr:DMT family transporter [Alphaproteobacteria bacterium]